MWGNWMNSKTKAAIEQLSARGFSGRKIGRTLGIPKSTVNDYLAKLREEKAAHPSGAKVLALDIETSPAIAYVWGRHKQYVAQSQVIQDPYILTWTAKWLGSPNIMQDSVHLHVGPEQLGKPHDREVVQSLRDLIDQADVLLYHNGDRFDRGRLYARLAHYQIPPPHPARTIDTLKIAKAQFAFPSNKLDDLAEYLGVAHRKLPTSFDLWGRCMQGDLSAYEYMLDYNAGDVQVLEDVYMRLRAFDRRHPNLALYDGAHALACTCGSTDLTPTGRVVTTGVSVFDTYRCNTCSRVVRDRSNKLTKEQRKNVLTNVAR